MENLILDDLRFPAMNQRYEGSKKSHKETFDWVFKENLDQSTQGEDRIMGRHHHNTGTRRSDFSKWLVDGCGIYWINGKAGSGKLLLAIVILLYFTFDYLML